MAVKIEIPSAQQRTSTISKEAYYLKIINKNSNSRHFPKLYGNGYFGASQILKLEYIEYSIEDYILKP